MHPMSYHLEPLGIDRGTLQPVLIRPLDRNVVT